MTTKEKVATALLKIGSVGFAPSEKPITFKSGIMSPVYVDNRKLPSFPAEWKVVIKSLGQLIVEAGLQYDFIAGIETAGIPHSSALGWDLEKPTVFIRKEAKDHGTKKRVEGGTVAGKRVLLLEDHITTGGSSLSGVEALRAEGATVTDCLAITSYAFAESDQAFEAAGVALHVLTDFETILAIAIAQNLVTQQDSDAVTNWLADPHAWTEYQKGKNA